MNIRAELAAIKRRLAWASGVRKRSEPFELIAVVVDDREQLRRLENAYAGQSWPWTLPPALRPLVDVDGDYMSLPAEKMIQHAPAKP